MKKSTKRLLAAVLSVVMILGALPLTALADNYSAASPKDSAYEVGDIYAIKRDYFSNNWGELPAHPENTEWQFVNEGFCDNPDHGSADATTHFRNQWDTDTCGYRYGLSASYKRYRLVSTDGGESGGETITEPGTVTANKGLANVDRPDSDGYYTIELTVQGNKILHSTGTASDVVLVVDNSGSMDTKINSKDNKPDKPDKPDQGGSGNQKDRLDIAVEAGKKFAEILLDGKQDNRIAVVGFAGSDGGANDSAAIKANATLDFTSSKTSVESALSRMDHDGGTNYTAALQKAYDFLSNRTDKTRTGYVVFLSDGAPGKSGDSQNDPNWNGEKQAAAIKGEDYTSSSQGGRPNQQQQLQKLENVELYTIGIALNENSNELNYLNSLSSGEGYHFNITDENLETQLELLLADIAYQINEVPAGTDAIMTDIINPSYFVLVDAQDITAPSGTTVTTTTVDGVETIMWNIGDIPESGATLTFKVKVKDGVLDKLDGSKEVPTNKDVNLTYKDPDGEDKEIKRDDIGDPKVTLTGTQKYTLTYDGNGGKFGTGDDAAETKVDETKYASGATATLDFTNTPTHEAEDGKNVVFIGWSAEKDTTIYGKGDTVPTLINSVEFSNENETVYAVWGYDVEGGESGGDNVPDVYQATVTYKIEHGWWNGAKTDNADRTYTGDLYEKKDGLWVTKNATLGANIPDVTEAAPEEHYGSGHWKGEMPTAETDLVNGEVYTYSFDEADKYTYSITYVKNAGDDDSKVGNMPDNVSESLYDTTKTYNVSSETPTRDGYTFNGWNSESNGSGSPYSANSEVSFPLTGSENVRGITLYAQWEKNTATDLSVTKEVTSINNDITNTTKAEVGDTITWTITVTNSGDAGGTFKLEDELSKTGVEDMTSLTVTPTDNDVTAENGYYTIAAPADGEEKTEMTFTATYTVTADDNGKTLTNNVTMTVDGENNPRNPVSSGEVEVDSDPDLSVTKTVYSIGGNTGATEAKIGDEIIWKIEVKNDGEVAGKITLTDKLNETAELDIYPNKNFTESEKVTGEQTINANDTKTYYVKYTVTPNDAGANLQNSVSVETPEGDPTPTPTNPDPVPVEGTQNVYVYFKTVDTNNNLVTTAQGVNYNQFAGWVTVGKIVDVPTSKLNKTDLTSMFETDKFTGHGELGDFNLGLVTWNDVPTLEDGANDYSEEAPNGTNVYHFDGKVTVYKLTYDTQGGGTVTADTDGKYYLNGTTINTLADGSNLKTSDGKVFSHWATKDADDNYTMVTSVTFDNADITLYAVYKDAPAAKLSVEKTVYKVGDTLVENPNDIPEAKVGEDIIWKITVTNTGDAAGYFKLEDALKASDNLPIYKCDADGGILKPTEEKVEYWPQLVENGETGTVSFFVKYTVKQEDVGTTLTNKVTLTETKQDGTDPDPKPDPDENEAPGVDVGGLTVEKTVKTVDGKNFVKDTTVAKVGDKIVWTITVKNYSKEPATFKLNDDLYFEWFGGTHSLEHDGVKPVPGATAGEDDSWTITGKGDSEYTEAVFEVSYTVEDAWDGKTLINYVEIPNPNDPENPIDNDKADGVPVEGTLSVSKSVWSIKGSVTDWDAESEADMPIAKIGDVIEWMITVRYTGDETVYVGLEDAIEGKTGALTIYRVKDGVETEIESPVKIESTSADGHPNYVSFVAKYTVTKADYGNKLINVVTMTEKDDDGNDKEQTAKAEEVEVEKKPNTPTYNPNYNAGVQLEKGEHFNYVIGYNDGTVRPEGNITRAEVATIFFRLLTDESRKTYMCQTNSFTDVQKNMWHNVAISTLANAGILNGYTDGSFRPDANITRAEMAAIIARFAELEGATKISFTDIKGHWAEKSILLAASNGWINGYNDGSFRPDQNITRAETMAMINRVLERKVEHVEDLVKDMNTWVDNMDTTQWYYFDVQEATNYHSYERKYTNTFAEKWVKKLTDIDWTVYQY